MIVGRYVDEAGQLAGTRKWDGEDLAEVAVEDPGFLRHMLEEYPLDSEDREKLEAALNAVAEAA